VFFSDLAFREDVARWRGTRLAALLSNRSLQLPNAIGLPGTWPCQPLSWPRDAYLCCWHNEYRGHPIQIL